MIQKNKFNPLCLELARTRLNEDGKTRQNHLEKKLTLIRAAELSGFSKSKICRWESGETIPKINELLVMAECYGVGPDFFYNNDAKA